MTAPLSSGTWNNPAPSPCPFRNSHGRSLVPGSVFSNRLLQSYMASFSTMWLSIALQSQVELPGKTSAPLIQLHGSRESLRTSSGWHYADSMANSMALNIAPVLNLTPAADLGSVTLFLFWALSQLAWHTFHRAACLYASSQRNHP
jgi:hypothetical protein